MATTDTTTSNSKRRKTLDCSNDDCITIIGHKKRKRDSVNNDNQDEITNSKNSENLEIKFGPTILLDNRSVSNSKEPTKEKLQIEILSEQMNDLVIQIKELKQTLGELRFTKTDWPSGNPPSYIS